MIVLKATGLLFIILFFLLALQSCSKKAVIVTADPNIIKGCDGSFVMLGSSQDGPGNLLIQKLCTRDIAHILELAGIDLEKRKEIHRLICSSSSSPERFKEFFSNLSLKERQSVIRAFELFGYEINGYGC